MGADSLEIRFSPSDQSEFIKLQSLFDGADSEYFSDCAFSKRDNGIVSFRFYEGAELQTEHLLPLYVFVAAHCDTAPSMRICSSATGGVTFISSPAGKPEWSEADTPLAGFVIAAVGGRGFDYDHLEAMGAVCREEFADDVNLLAFGEKGDAQWLEQARSNGVRVVSEEELDEITEGWDQYPPSVAAWNVADTERARLRGISSMDSLSEYFKASLVRAPKRNGVNWFMYGFFGILILVLAAVGFGAFWLVSLLVSNR